jgi:rhodanese-related sulfurtransferase
MGVGRTLASIAVALTLLFALSARASAQNLRIIVEDDNHSGPDKFKLIHADDLANMMSKSPVQIYDANFPETRRAYGVVDGAHLLSSYDNYNVAKELPADKNTQLVFYCYDKRCMASHVAARRAIDAGYKNVAVMSDGIVIWHAMNEPIHHVSQAESMMVE